MSVSQETSFAHAVERLSSADIKEARKLVGDIVRLRPSDQRARMFLFQLLCVECAWAKASSQLRALETLSPEARILAAAYGQAIEGELHRAEVFRAQAPASLLVDAPDWAVDIVDALAADPQEAAARRASAFDRCPDTPGEIDGKRFDFLFDPDNRFGPTFEAIVAGRWGLIPFSAVEEIETEGPVDLRDMVWLPAEIRFRQGPALAAMLPVRYPDIETESDTELLLSRRTEWREHSGALRGAGQRVWTTSGGDDVDILSFRHVRFAALS